MSSLLAATAVVDITPPPGHPLAGYVARSAVATGTADPLQATLTWIAPAVDDCIATSGTRSVAGRADDGVLWLSIDAMAVDTVLAGRLAAAAGSAAGIPAERVLVCASHSHSAPSGWSGSVHPVITAAREPALEAALVDRVASALLRLEPVLATWHTIDVTGLGTNRYDPAGPHHRRAGILALRRPVPVHDHEPGAPRDSRVPVLNIAPDVPRGTAVPDLPERGDDLVTVLLDYACHPTVLGPDNLLWSADWPGAVRRALGVPVGFLQGAAGDVSPRFTRQGRDTAEVDRLGTILATAVRSALDSPGEAVTAAPAVRRTTVILPVRALPSVDELEATIDRALAATRPATPGQADSVEPGRDGSVDSGGGVLVADTPAGRIATTRLEGARGQAAMSAAGLPPTLDLPLSVVTLGDVAWVHLPAELFSTLGDRIRATSPYETTRVICYTDGYFGYVVDPAAVEAEVYESLISYFDTPTTDALVDAAVGLLRRTHAT